MHFYLTPSLIAKHMLCSRKRDIDKRLVKGLNVRGSVQKRLAMTFSAVRRPLHQSKVTFDRFDFLIHAKRSSTHMVFPSPCLRRRMGLTSKVRL
jgi:hypothetical protein